MQKQKMNVEKMQETCTLKREKKTPELFSSLACESQLGCMVRTSLVVSFAAGFDSGVPMTDLFEPHLNLKVGNGQTVPFSEFRKSTKMLESCKLVPLITSMDRKIGSRSQGTLRYSLCTETLMKAEM
jgi:hypothetical protein